LTVSLTETYLSQDKGGTHGKTTGQSNRARAEGTDARAAHQPFAARVLAGPAGT